MIEKIILNRVFIVNCPQTFFPPSNRFCWNPVLSSQFQRLPLAAVLVWEIDFRNRDPTEQKENRIASSIEMCPICLCILREFTVIYPGTV